MPYARGPDPSPSFRFCVEIDGIQVARFSECSGLSFESETFDYKEGGMNSHPHRFPGHYKFSNVTLKKGVAADGEVLWTWVKSTVKNANSGSFVTHNVTVTLFDVSGQQPLRSWVFLGAYPVQWNATALSAEQNAIAIETLVLAHQGMDIAQ